MPYSASMRASAHRPWNLEAFSMASLVVGLAALLGAFVVPGLEPMAIPALVFLVPGLLIGTR
jgi:hypothetical protein